jgi:hypothetical protein
VLVNFQSICADLKLCYITATTYLRLETLVKEWLWIFIHRGSLPTLPRPASDYWAPA